MHRFTQYLPTNAPEASRPWLQQVHEARGFVPNLYATFAESPVSLEGYMTLERSLSKGALSRVERELVEITVSTENGCPYCVAAHCTSALELGAHPEIVAAVRDGARVPDARIEALIRFTRAVMRHKAFMSADAISAFLDAGYSKAQLMEVVGHIALKTWANYLHAMTQTPLDDVFKGQVWDRQQLQVA